MSVEQVDVVDAIGVENESGNVILTISDHLGWEDEEAHLLLLQSKLNTYLRFVESGELLDVYPDAAGRGVVIHVVARVGPTESAAAFLEQARAIVRTAGFELRAGTLK